MEERYRGGRATVKGVLEGCKGLQGAADLDRQLDLLGRAEAIGLEVNVRQSTARQCTRQLRRRRASHPVVPQLEPAQQRRRRGDAIGGRRHECRCQRGATRVADAIGAQPQPAQRAARQCGGERGGTSVADGITGQAELDEPRARG